MNNLLFDSIKVNSSSVMNKKITLGFDGFIDVICKVVRSKNDESEMTFFKSIQEFGNYITEKGEKNFSLELEEMTTKIGGNMPIMANALAQFGCRPNCIGPLGYPTINPVLQQMAKNCELYSFADPGLAKALEFNGSKIMFAEIGNLNRIAWRTIKEIIGLETIVDLYSMPDLVCILNWSELDNSTAIWNGLLTDVLPRISHVEHKPIGFFDLADCSKRTPESILDAMNLLRAFSKYWNIVLSLNMNEATIVNCALTGKNASEKNVEEIGASLFDQLGISNVVIHYAKQALSWNASGVQRAESFFISNPAISTGAGDNFNAGYCAGLLMELDAHASLILGHTASNYYMTHGKSASIPDLLEFLNNK
jgi:hypothetical protein